MSNLVLTFAAAVRDYNQKSSFYDLKKKEKKQCASMRFNFMISSSALYASRIAFIPLSFNLNFLSFVYY